MSKEITIVDRDTYKMHTLLADVPTTFGWKVKIALSYIPWILWASEQKKNWKEFYYGLIKHECEYDYDNLKSHGGGLHYKCKHFGCNIVTIQDRDGNWM